MKRSLKSALASLRIGIAAERAYLFDFVVGVFFIPLAYFLIEVAFWTGLIQTSANGALAGFTTADYLSYFLWLLLRIGGLNWRFERDMIADVNSGAVNAFLLRPSSFFEYNLMRLLGQKMLTVLVMTPVVVGIAWGFNLPFHLERLPAALLMGFLYLILTFSLHFAVACGAFFYDNVYSLNITKNMLLWFLTGETMPLDLLPAPIARVVIALPFSAGVYLPAAYLSGRIGTAEFLPGFVSLAVGGLLFALLARWLWMAGLKNYSGTGA